ncbi:PAS fold family [Coleofasciculus chthonoplastes PCC 7420]|uniref:histidine kinase n=1 Tax=Coleofasciculus chthonoplastes PCC 7420 TaxID=118168 RepID=B4VQ40_9CYAN|nr:PAS domain-containing protein [Coleofasciculus chthonoplastes]EDX75959.1 PAS fold family [Coleofasciculus chthonoplastes PCC 7420]
MEPQTYAQLQQRNQFLESIYQSVAHPITVIDVLPSGEFRFVEINLASERWMGKRLEEVKDKSPEQIFPAAEATAIVDNYTRCVQERRAIVYETYCQSQDSWWLTTLTPLYNQESRIYRLISSSLNITERRKKEVNPSHFFNKILISNLNQRTLDLRHTSQKLVQEIQYCQHVNRKLKESEQNLRQIAETLREVLFIRTVNQMIYVSPAYEKIWGLSCDSLYQQPESWQDVIHPDDRDRVITEWQTHVWDKPFEQEYRIIQPNGEQRWIWARTLPIIDDFGQVNRNVGIAEDITDRKQVEERLRQSQAKLAEAEELAHLGHWHYDITTHKITWSAETFRIFGRDPDHGEPTYAQLVHQITHPDDRKYFTQTVAHSIQHKQPYKLDYRLIRPNGSIRHIFAKGKPILNSDNQIIGVFGTILDITNLKQTEAALRQSEETFRQFAENIQDVFWMTNVEKTKNIYISPAYETIWGQPCASWYTDCLSWLDTIHPDDRDRIRSAIHKEVLGEYDEEYRILRPDGEMRWIRDRAFPIYNEQGEMYRIAGIAQDITERKQTELALQKSEQRFRQIFDHAPIGMSLINFHTHQFIQVNPAYYQTLGYSESEIMSLTFDDFTHPDDLGHDLQYMEQIYQGEIDSFRMPKRYFKKNGEIVWANLTVAVLRDLIGEPVFCVAMIEDITHQQQLQDELTQSEHRIQTSLDNILDCFGLYKPIRDDSGQIIDFVIEYVNDATNQYHCFTQPVQRGQRIYSILPPAYQDELFNAYCQVLETGQPLLKELLFYDDLSHPQNLRQAFDIRAVRFDDGLAVTWRDITQRQQAEAQIKASLIEKETLLKEIHHRVKNNLQIISSLLRLQARKLKTPEILDLLQESQNRVQAMALIHEKLYQSEHLSKINFGTYIKSLVYSLSRCYGARQKGITFNLTIAPVSLSIDTAIPCGLIINELVSNSLKYAFTDSRNGEIGITLQTRGGTNEGEGEDQGDRGNVADLSWVRSRHFSAISAEALTTNSKVSAIGDGEDGENNLTNATSDSLSSVLQEQLCLTIGDNGIGFPEDVDFRQTSSLGLQLVCRLAKQLNGEITLDRNQGTLFIIIFNRSC